MMGHRKVGRFFIPAIPQFAPQYIAFLSIIGAVLASFVLWPITIRHPFLFFWPTILISAWHVRKKSTSLSILYFTLAIGVSFQTLGFQISPDVNDLTTQMAYLILASFAMRIVIQSRKFVITHAQQELELRQALFEAIPMMLTVYSPDTRIVTLNPEFERLTGWTNEAARGISLMEAIYPDPIYRAEVAAYMSSLVPGWRDIEMVARDGHVIQSVWANIRLTDERQVGIGIDITQLKQTENRLRIREHHNQVLQELTAALSMVLSVHEVARISLEQVMRTLGARSGSFQLYDAGTGTFSALHRAQSTLSEEQLAHWQTFAAHPEYPITDVVRQKKAIWFSNKQERVMCYPALASLPDSLAGPGALLPLFVGNRVMGAIALTFGDEPRTFTADEQSFAMQLVDQCAQAFERARLYEGEQKARQEAEIANETKLKFLAMISHELRTPLTSIKGFSSTLLAPDVTWDASSQHEFIEIIDHEANKLQGMIEQLLDLSRMQAGMLSINPKPTYVADILATAQPQLETLTREHQPIQLIPANLPPVAADNERVVQVLLNLVGNAVKYAPPRTQITVSVQQEGNFIVFKVCDEGPGIPPEMRNAVFEAFRQLANAKQGVGLGLAICKGLVEAHGGRIWIEDVPAPGTQVCFTLPIVPTSQPEVTLLSAIV